MTCDSETEYIGSLSWNGTRLMVWRLFWLVVRTRRSTLQEMPPAVGMWAEQALPLR
jgi:hypothetical protein